jgi:pyruvate dehydrogenase E1 component alpha subunit/2-oxoisovalerate dehydrogenase E1 component alpha subunit
LSKKKKNRDRYRAPEQSAPAAPRAGAPFVAPPAAQAPHAAKPQAPAAALSPDGAIQMLRPDGTLHPGAAPRIDDPTLLRVHDTMRLVRALDERMITLQRQGRAGFYGACTGEEAAVLGTASALRATDWIFPALRQNAAMLFRGFPLTAYVCQVLGNSGDPNKARQMPSHHAALSVRQVSWSSCIANQLPQAIGLARAIELKGEDDVAVGYCGDGGTSEGEFHVAMNLAALWKPPIVLVVQNNQWAISVPLERQTLVTRIADKAAAYGMPGVRVDGNDVLAVHAVMSEAVERARRGDGPTLVETFTYRVGAHSTSDDPSRYRDESITERWKQLDPVTRLETYLAARGLRSRAEVEEITRRSIAEVDRSVREAEATPPVAAATLIEDVYAAPPQALLEQWRAWGHLPVTRPHAG